MGDHMEKAAKAFDTGKEHINRYKSRLDKTLRIEGLQKHIKSGPDKPSEP